MENLDWANLPFQYHKTDYNVRCYWRNGKWGELEVSSSEYVNLHMSATGLQYGQQAFEGMKAFRGKDGRIRLFRWPDNAKRLYDSAIGIKMSPVPDELFIAAVKKAILLNTKYVPPYGSGASLYIRPLLIGSGPEVGIRPSSEYMFVVFVSPVGPYFKYGFKPVEILIERRSDRAAPLGTGHLKVGGNYAASLGAIQRSRELGYATVLYLDAREKRYIDECGPANFFGIRDGVYITPDSKSVLPSITNRSLIQLAESIGLKIERRPIPIEELETFEEAGACGTAAVISPIGKAIDIENGRTYTFSKDGEPGEVCTKLYRLLQQIQIGDVPDKYGWVEIID